MRGCEKTVASEGGRVASSARQAGPLPVPPSAGPFRRERNGAYDHAALQDIRDVIEQKLAQMLARNPMRMDFYRKYQEIIADYNREKDRVTVEETFAELVALASGL